MDKRDHIKVSEPTDENVWDDITDRTITAGRAAAAAASPAASSNRGRGMVDDDDEDAGTEFTTETVNRQWSTGTNSDDRRKQRKWLLNFINKYVPPDVDEGDAFVVVKVLVEAEIITVEQVEEDQKRATGTQRFMSYFEELTDAEWDSTGRITALYLGYKDLRDCPWELHPDIGRLNKLRHLTVGWCVGLPAELSHLHELETLKVTMSVDEMQYEMPASEPPAVKLSSLKELDAKAAPGAEGFDLASWISNSSFPTLEVLTLEDEPMSTFQDIVSVMKSLKKNKSLGHHGLRQLSVTNFEIGENFDTFLLKTIPDNASRLETLKFQDGKPYLESVTHVASRLRTGDVNHSFTTSANHLTTLDLQETELFGHRGGECLIDNDTENSAMTSLVKRYKKLTVVGFTPDASVAGSPRRAATGTTSRAGKAATGGATNHAKASNKNKMLSQPNKNQKNKNNSANSTTSSKASDSNKKTKRESKSSNGNRDAAPAKPITVKSEPQIIYQHVRRGDSNIGRRFAKFFNMKYEEGDFEKVFFGTITKKIASETKPLHYTVEFDDGDTLDLDIPEIQEGLELYDEQKGKDRKKGGTKRKR